MLETGLRSLDHAFKRRLGSKEDCRPVVNDAFKRYRRAAGQMRNVDIHATAHSSIQMEITGPKRLPVRKLYSDQMSAMVDRRNAYVSFRPGGYGESLLIQIDPLPGAGICMNNQGARRQIAIKLNKEADKERREETRAGNHEDKKPPTSFTNHFSANSDNARRHYSIAPFLVDYRMIPQSGIAAVAAGGVPPAVLPYTNPTAESRVRQDTPPQAYSEGILFRRISVETHSLPRLVPKVLPGGEPGLGMGPPVVGGGGIWPPFAAGGVPPFAAPGPPFSRFAERGTKV